MCGVEVEVEDGGGLDSGFGSSLGSRYPTGILGKRVVKERLQVELVVCQFEGLGCLNNSPTQTRPVSYLSRSRGTIVVAEAEAGAGANVFAK